MIWQQIGRVVRQVRLRRRLALKTLAEQTQVTELTLQTLDDGSAVRLTTTEFGRIAEALELDPVALRRGEEVPLRRPSVFLRQKRHADFHADDHAVLDEALDEARALATLAPPGDARGGRRDVFEQRDAAGKHPARDGYACATEVRRALGSPVNPLGDLRRLVEASFGVTVVVRSLRTARATAASVRDGFRAAAIVLNARDGERRDNPLVDRVHLAHELCHILFDRSMEGPLHVVLDVVDRDGQIVERNEQRARGFAAEFLLPLMGIKELLGPPAYVAETSEAQRMVKQVQQHFVTPWEIAAHHLHNHGFIDESIHDWVVRHRPSTPPLPPELSLPEADAPSQLLVERVREAHKAARITDGQARKALRIPLDASLPWE